MGSVRSRQLLRVKAFEVVRLGELRRMVGGVRRAHELAHVEARENGIEKVVGRDPAGTRREDERAAGFQERIGQRGEPGVGIERAVVLGRGFRERRRVHDHEPEAAFVVRERSHDFERVADDPLVPAAADVRVVRVELEMAFASGDGVYKLDYGKVLEQHIDKGADITIVTKDINPEEDEVELEIENKVLKVKKSDNKN